MSNPDFTRPIDHEVLPIGLSLEAATRVRKLANELREAGLNVLFSVSDNVERHMSILTGDAMVLLPVTQDLSGRLTRQILEDSVTFARNEA